MPETPNKDMEDKQMKDREAELQKIIADAQAELAALPKKPKTVWDLEDDDECYTMHGNGVILRGRFEDHEREYRNQGNVFLTEQEAEDKSRRRAIHTQLERLADGYEFTAGEDNWCLEWDYEYGRIYYFGYSLYSRHANTVYFPTEQALEAAVAEIGEDNIKFYLEG